MLDSESLVGSDVRDAPELLVQTAPLASGSLVRSELQATYHIVQQTSAAPARDDHGDPFGGSNAAEQWQPPFVVSTEYTADGPRAVVSINPDASTSIPTDLQSLSVELRSNGKVLEIYEILIDLVEADFQERFLADRQLAVAQEIQSTESGVREEWLGEKGSISARLARGEEVAGVTERDLMRNLPRDPLARRPVATMETLGGLAKRQFDNQDVFVDNAERVRLYGELLSLAKEAKDNRALANTASQDRQVADDARQVGRTALLLAGEIKADLSSRHTATADAARKLRDELANLDDPYYTLFTGLGIDREVERTFLSNGKTKAVAFTETGRYDFSDRLSVDLSGRSAMVQVVYRGLNRSAAAYGVAGDVHVDDGYIYSGNPDDPTGYGASSTGLYVSGSIGLESLVRFNLGQITDLTNPTPVSEAFFQLQEINASSSASVDVLIWNGLIDGGAGSTTDWNDSTLNWNHVISVLDYPGRLNEFTQLDTFTSGETFSVDATDQLRRALMFGDANGDGVFDSDGQRGDIEAFHLAVTDWDAYTQEYGLRAGAAEDLLARNDGGLGDGVIDTSDIADFFRRHGRSQGDFNLDGVVDDNQGGVDGLDWAIWSANYGLTNARFSQGDGNFDGAVNAADLTIWDSRTSEDNLAVETPQLMFWLRPTDPTNGGLVSFASSENTTEQGPTLTIEGEPDLAVDRFAIENGNVVVDYAVLGEDFSSVKVQVYRVGSSTPVHTASGLGGAVGGHTAIVPASVLSSATESDSFYAIVSGVPSSASPEANLANNSLDFEFSTDRTQVVDSSDDGGMDTLLSSKHTLRELVDANNVLGWYDTIELRLDGKTLDLTEGEIAIESDLRIVGLGADRTKIDAINASRAFNISPGVEAYLGDLTISRGSSSDDGGGIYNLGDLTLQSVRLENNDATQNGGAVYTGVGSLSVFDSTIYSNNADVAGAGIYLVGGSLELTRSTVLGNDAGFYGAGIAVDMAGAASVVIDSSLVAENETVNASGLALFATPLVQITNSTFSKNTATDGYGGGIYYQGYSQPATFQNLTVTENKVGSAPPTGSEGAGIYLVSADGIVIQSSIVAGNTDLSEAPVPDLFGTFDSSSGYNLIGISSGFNGIVDDSNYNKVGSVSQPELALLSSLGDFGGPTLTHALLPGSPAIDAGDSSLGSADQRGFSYYDEPATVGLTDIGAFEYQGEFSLIVNTSADIAVAESELSLRQAIALASATPGFDTITFDPDIFSTLQVISLKYDSDDADTTPDELLLDSDLSIVGPGANRLIISGEGVSRLFNVVDSAAVSIESLHLADGCATDNGGAIANYGELTLEGVMVSDSGDSTGSSGATRRGGAVFNDSALLTIRDSYFEGNTAEYGGAIYVLGSSVVDISGSTFYNNRAKSEGEVVSGGAIRTYASASNLNIDISIDNSTFSSNRSDGYGGAIGIVSAGDWSPGSIAVTNTTLTQNFASGSGGGIVRGGYVVTTLDNTIAVGNTSTTADVWGYITGDYNLLGPSSSAAGPNSEILAFEDLKLGPLGNHGGLTPTYVPLPDSPAVGAGSNSLVPAGVDQDQRGTEFDRVSGIAVDIGATELQQYATITDFSSDGENLTVTYTLEGSPVDSLRLDLFASADGEQLEVLLDSIAITSPDDRTVGVPHTITITPDFRSSDIDEDYHLVANLRFTAESVSGSAIRAFQGGVFSEVDSTLHVHGTDGNDVITIANELVTLSGPGISQTNSQPPAEGISHVVVHSHEGADQIQADIHASIFAGPGNDVVNSGAGDDLLVGGSGDDIYLFAGSVALGDDMIVELPGEGQDTLDFSGVTNAAGVVIDLNSHGVLQSPSQTYLTLDGLASVEIENVTGTPNADTLAGNAAANVLHGLAGDDIIYGLGGVDQLEGGAGEDILRGGIGVDAYDGGTDFDNAEVIDDSDSTPRFTQSGFTSQAATDAYGGDYYWLDPATLSGQASATWTFDGLDRDATDDNGFSVDQEYRVLVSWPSVVGAGSKVTFSVLALDPEDGTVKSIETTVDQSKLLTDRSANDQFWCDLGAYVAPGSGPDYSLEVTLEVDSGDPDVGEIGGLVLADAVRLEKVDHSLNKYDYRGSVFHDLNGNGVWDVSGFELDSDYVVFVIDVSGSAGDPFTNGHFENVLDAELAGVSALSSYIREQQLLTSPNLQNTKLAVVAFSEQATVLDMDPSTNGVQPFALPSADVDGDGLFDVEERINFSGLAPQAGTDYDVGLQEVIDILAAETSPGAGDDVSVVFLSDGEHNGTGRYADEVSVLRNEWGADLRAVSVGPIGALPDLRLIDPNARTFSSVDQFLSLFNATELQAAESGLEDWLVYIDVDKNGVRDAGEPFVYTDEKGYFRFHDIEAQFGQVTEGAHDIRLQLMPGYEASTPLGGLAAGPLPDIQTDFGPFNEAEFEFGIGLHSEIAVGGLSGTKYLDSNRNGRRDSEGLIVGDLPAVIFVIDRSGSTRSSFVGTYAVDDWNGDGRSNTILDAEIAAFDSLRQQLISDGLGDTADVAVITFDDESVVAQGWDTPNSTLITALAGGATSYESPLQHAIALFNDPAFVANSAGKTKNLVFLSDGFPNRDANGQFDDGFDVYSDEVDTLLGMGVHLRAFGAGRGSSLPALRAIDSLEQFPGDPYEAKQFLSPDGLLDVFSGVAQETAASWLEIGIAQWPIYLYRDENHDGSVDGEELLQPFATTYTNESGDYFFENLLSGTYLVREGLLDHYSQTGPASGSNVPYGVTLVPKNGVNEYLVELSPADEVLYLSFGNAVDPITNVDPEFTSTRKTSATVGELYSYTSTATDQDATDTLEFTLPPERIVWPGGFTPDSGEQFAITDVNLSDDSSPTQEYGLITWMPPAELAGKTVRVYETVTDTFGNEVSRPIDIYVTAPAANYPPAIISTPNDTYTHPLPIPMGENLDSVQPDSIQIKLGDGEERQIDVSISVSDAIPSADIVFVVDTSGSMNGALEWLSDVIPSVENQLNALDIQNNRYGLVLFGTTSSIYAAPLQLFDTAWPINPAGNQINGTTWQALHPEPDVDIESNKYSDDVWGTADQLAWALKNIDVDGGPEYGQDAITKVLNHYSFRGRNEATAAAGDIIIVTDDESQAFTQESADQIVDALQASTPGDPSDDIVLSAILTSQLSGDDEAGNANYMIERAGSWGVAGESYVTEPMSPSSVFLSSFDWQAFYADSHQVAGGTPSDLSSGNWSLFSSLTIEQAAPGLRENARLYFNINDSHQVAAETPLHWYLEADVATQTWRLGSNQVGQGYSGPYEISSGGIAAGKNYDVELRQQYIENFTNRYDLFVDAAYIGSVEIGDAEMYGGDWLADTTFGVGAEGARAIFDNLRVISLASDSDFAESEPTDVPEWDAVHFEADFGTDGYTFDASFIGADIGGFAYLPDGGGGNHLRHNAGVVRAGLNQERDYVNPVLSVGGSVWNLDLLRDSFPPTPQHLLDSFTAGFSHSLSREILGQLLAGDVVSDSDLFVGSERILDGSASALQANFSITLVGDGKSHAFDLEFVPDGFSEGDAPLGAIPVAVTAAYSHDFIVDDFENDEPYTIDWDPEYVDAEGHPLNHGAELLDSGREGYLNDRLVWDPPEVSEDTYFDFHVIVRDNVGNVGKKTWTVTVKPASSENVAPEIVLDNLTTDPVDGDEFDGLPLLRSAKELHSYTEPVPATDANVDDQTDLRYYLAPTPLSDGTEVPPPSWLSIDRNTGELSGRPGSYSLGPQLVTVLVSDGKLVQHPYTGQVIGLGEDRQTFVITVEERDYINAAPTVEQIPDLVFRADNPLPYPVEASDFDRNDLLFEVRGPEGISIHPTEGVISWSPKPGQLEQAFYTSVDVSDGQATTTRSFYVYAEPKNRAPVITTELPDGVTFLDYAHPLEATDKDGNYVTFSLVDGPEGMEIVQGVDGVQRLVWLAGPSPNTITAGTFDVTIAADDGLTGSDKRTYQIEISESAPPLLSVSGPAVWRVDLAGTLNQTATLVFQTKEEANPPLNVRLDLDSRARGMSLDAAGPGVNHGGYWDYPYTLTWNPSNDSDAAAKVEVLFGAGHMLSATYDVPFDVELPVVQADSKPPEFKTLVLGAPARNSPFTKQVVVVDPEKEQFTVEVVADKTNAPGFTDANVSDSGLIQWIPPAAGTFEITLRAIDASAKPSYKTYSVTVSENAAPTIKPSGLVSPVLTGLTEDFEYQFEVTDPNVDDTVSVELNAVAESLGLKVEPVTETPGLWRLYWSRENIEANSSPGMVIPVAIKPSDNHGLSPGRLRFDLPVFDSNDTAAPITGDLELDLPAGTEFSLPFRIQNNGGVGATYSLEFYDGGSWAPAPPELGITISSGGQVEWIPSLDLLLDDAPDPGDPQHYKESKLFEFRIVLDVSGANPFQVTRDLDINVFDPTKHQPATPVVDFETTPAPLAAVAEQTLVYDPSAYLDGDGAGNESVEFEWELVYGPFGMEIDPQTGRLTWTPDKDLINSSVDVVISVAMPGGASRLGSFSLDVVGSNQTPTVVGSFPTKWSAGEAFTFPAHAIDPEGHALEYLLLSATNGPALESYGISINADTGEISWTNPEAGDYLFHIVAREKHRPDSASESRELQLSVIDGAVNADPIITNTPYGKTANVDDEFAFQFQVEDPEAENIHYSIDESRLDASISPADWGIEEDTGLFTWTPREVGPKSFTVIVTDTPPSGSGLAANATRLTFTINAAHNQRPVIVSDDHVERPIGVDLTHWVQAVDPEHTRVTFSLVESGDWQPGMKIDPHTGVFTWKVPSNISTNTNYVVTVLAEDADGMATEHPLTVTATAVDDVKPDLNFYITDGKGNVVAPTDELNGDDPSEYKLWFSIEDNLGHGSGEVNWLLEVFDSGGLNVPGIRKAQLSDTRGGLISTTFTGGLNSGLLYVTLTAGDADGVVLPAEPTADDIVGNKASRTFRYNVFSEIQGRYANLMNVDSDEGVLVVDERFEVRGVANSVDPDAAPEPYGQYDLKLVSLADPTDFFYIEREKAADRGEVVKVDTEPTGPVDVVLGTLDPTLIPSGQYRLYLEVRCPEGCIVGIDEQVIEIRNDARLGNLDLSFTDLSVDLGGIPVSLQRQYQSSTVGTDGTSFSGDFGPGWTLNILQAGVNVGHPQQVTSNLSEPIAEQTRVLVQLPDGSVHRFEFDAVPVGNSNQQLARPVILPDPDVDSTLELIGFDDSTLISANELRDDGTFLISGSGKEFSPQAVASEFALTTSFGLRYRFDITTGKLKSIEDNNGHSVVITHNEGASTTTIAAQDASEVLAAQITIHYDASGRIDWIEDPAGAQLEYKYGDYNPATHNVETPTDGYENLSRVIPRRQTAGGDDESVYYDYMNSEFKSHLTEIYDSGRVRVLRANYYGRDDFDENVNDPQKVGAGRLKELVDATNNTAGLGFIINLGDGRTVTRVHSGGIEVDEVTDSRGNVLRSVQLIDAGTVGDDTDDRYLITASVYNLRGDLLRESMPFIVVGTANRYDEMPESDSEALGYNPEDWATILTFDEQGRRESDTNAHGETNTFEYDDQDRVVSVTGADGVVTRNIYDTYTGDLLETYLHHKDTPAVRFNHTRYQYDRGQITETLQVDGNDEILVSRSDYNSDGRISSTLDAAGKRTYFGYDVNGNQTHSWTNWTAQSGAAADTTLVSVTNYDDDGRVTDTEEHEIQHPGGYSDFITLKSAIALATPLWTTETHYDDSRVSYTVDRYGAQTHYLYDLRGQVVESRTTAKNEAGVAGWMVTRTLYDDQGRTSFVTDPYFVLAADYALLNSADPENSTWNGEVGLGTRTVYDYLGRVERTERWAGVTILLSDDDGDATPGEAVDNDDILTTLSDTDFTTAAPTSHSETRYDDLGRVEYTVDESGARTDYYYDHADRQVAVLGAAPAPGEARHLTFSVYGIGGRLQQAAANIAVDGAEGADAHPDLTINGTAVILAPGGAATVDQSAATYTYYEYDAAGRQTAVVTTAVDHDQDAGTARVHVRTESEYDSLGRRTGQTTGVTQTAPTAPTAALAGGVGSVDQSQARTTNYQYDNLGNLTAVILPEVAHPDTQQLVRPRYEYTYDRYGNRLTIRDNVVHNELTGEGLYDHDATNPGDDTRVTAFTYDHRGAQLTRTLPEGVATAGDPTDFVESMHYSSATLDTGAPASVIAGQLEYKVDFEGRVTAYLYDNSAAGGGRLTEKRFYASESDYTNPSGSPAETLSYTYDGFGQEKTVVFTRAAGVLNTAYEYDDEGRLEQVATTHVGSGVTNVVNYAYDQATGLQTRVWTTPTANASDPPITETIYTYDDLGRLDTVTSTRRNSTVVAAGGDQTDYDYDLLGNLARVTAPAADAEGDPVVADYAYDELSRLVDLVHYTDDDATPGFSAGDTLKARFQYELNANGQRVGSTDTDINGGVARYDWAYDALGRLTEEQFDYAPTPGTPDATHDYTTNFRFDLVGNRLTQEVDYVAAAAADKAIAYDYDKNDRLLVERLDEDASLGGTPAYDKTTYYDYDDADPTTAGDRRDATTQTAKRVYNWDQPVDPGADNVVTPADKVTSYAYNLQGRLSATTVDAGSPSPVTYEYAYDANGFRVTQSTGGVTTIYVADAQNPTAYTQVLEEQDAATGAVSRTYVLGHDVLMQTASAAAYHWLVYDGHGSTRVLLDESGAVATNSASGVGTVAQIYAYTAHGELIDISGYASAVSHALTTLLYSGEQTDGTGQQYLRARYYDSGKGRFNRLDPFDGNFEDPLSLHKYAYVHGDPIGGADPTGLFFGFSIALQRYGVSAQNAAVAYNALGSLQDVIDVGQIALQFATTGTVNPFDVAEVAFGLLPGSGVLKRISKIPLPLGKKVDISGSLKNASGFLTGVARSLDKSGVGVDILTNKSGRRAAISAVHNRAVRRIGELGNGLVAKQLGLTRVGNFRPRTHGIDQIYKKNGAFYIAEAKGGSSTLAGGQMTRAWIDRNIDRVGGALKRELRDALAQGNLYGLITSTPIDRVTGAIGNPSYVLKHIDKL